MRLGVMADIHGNDVALRAVLDDAAGCQVTGGGSWATWSFSARVRRRCLSSSGHCRVSRCCGETPTGEQPAPHATAADAAGSAGLVQRYGLMAAGIGWTRGVLCQAGLLGTLAGLPAELRLRFPDGTRVLGVHASPAADDGPGIRPGIPGEQLSRLLAGCAADVVIGGHTHIATDRLAGRIRALNPGSTGIPERPGEASWLFLEHGDGLEHHGDPGHSAAAGLKTEHRVAPFDADAVARDLRARLHPNAEFMEAILTGERQMQAPAG
jgi:hypothetical protein